MKRESRTGFLLVLSLVVVTVALPAWVIGHSAGPYDGKTGAPEELSCAQCHGTANGDGSITILGAPAVYQLNRTYPITVRIEDQGQKRWGFELTAINDELDGTGTFTVTDPVNTQLSYFAAPARSYIKHTSAGTRNGTSDGPVDFEFEWTAPPTNEGTITLYVAGNGADGSYTNSGDFIYTTNVSLTSETCCGRYTGGYPGNTNCDDQGKRSLADITKLIDRVYISKADLCCEANGNINGDLEGKLNLADITAFIDHLYISKLQTAPCL